MRFPLERLVLFLCLAAIVSLSFLLPLPGETDTGAGTFWSVPLCVFKAVTTIPCPFCGLTRSFVYTAHGRVGRAFCFHPAGPPLWALTVVAVLYHGAALVMGLRWGRKGGEGAVEPRRSGPARWAWPAVVLAILALWAVKLFVIGPDYW